MAAALVPSRLTPTATRKWRLAASGRNGNDHWLEIETLLIRPFQSALDVGRVTLKLHVDPAVRVADVGTPYVGHDVELLAKLVDHRLMQELRWIDELDMSAGHHLAPRSPRN